METAKVTPSPACAEGMAAATQGNLLHVEGDDEYRYHDGTVCGNLVRKVVFQRMALTLPMVFAVWTAMDIDNNAAASLLDASPIFIVVQWLFIIYWAFEGFVRFCALRRKADVGVLWDVFLTVLLLVASLVPAESGSVCFVLGMFKIAQLSRLGRVCYVIPELMVIMKGLICTMRAVFFSLLLLLAVLFVFGCCFTVLGRSSDAQLYETHFSTVAESMWMLATHVVFIGSPDNLWREFKDASPLGLVFFACFFIITYAIMFIMAGVIMEVVSEVSSTEKNKMMVTYLAQALQAVQCPPAFWTTKAGFLRGLKAEPGKTMQRFGINVTELSECADLLFAGGGFSSLEAAACAVVDLAWGDMGSHSGAALKDLRKQIMRLEHHLVSSGGGSAPSSAACIASEF